MTATAPLQRRQNCRHNNGKDASGDDASAMRATTPAQLWQQCQRNEDNNISAATITMLQQQQKHTKDASMTRVTTPAQRG
jgi:hypothetical protein